jgi:hypothetical protein
LPLLPRNKIPDWQITKRDFYIFSQSENRSEEQMEGKGK